MNNLETKSYIFNTFEHEIGINFITIRGVFGAKRVSVGIDIGDFRKIIKALQRLDEKENNIK
jgi:hypothetical protein